MEEMENEYEKGIYWVVFFVVILFAAFWGYEVVFNSKEVEKEEKEEVIESENYDSYVGIWQLFGNDDIPEYEFVVHMIDGETITFDFGVRDVIYYESKTATFDGDVARFEIDDDENKLVGKIAFKNDKVFFIITSSSLDGITVGTIEFSENGEESLLK